MVLVQLPAMFFLFRRFRSRSARPTYRSKGAFGGFRYFFALWIVMAVSMVLDNTQALRWALRTRWADFRLIAVDRRNPWEALRPSVRRAPAHSIGQSKVKQRGRRSRRADTFDT